MIMEKHRHISTDGPVMQFPQSYDLYACQAFSYENPLGFFCSIQQDDVICLVAHPFLSWCTSKSAARVEMTIHARF